MNVIVREIENKNELDLCFSIRKKVFVEEQKVPLEEEYDTYEDSSQHFLAFINNEPVGTARLRVTENGTKLERFCVLKESRKSGVGKALVKNLLTECNNKIHSQVYLFAQITAQKFYEKFGFEGSGELFIEAGIPHIKMLYKEKRESK